MKTQLFSTVLAILLFAFTVNSTILAQSKDSKSTDTKIKTTVQKIEDKKEDVNQTAGTTIHHKQNQTKGGINTVKNEVKSDLGKDKKIMMNKKVNKTKTVTDKMEKKPNEKIKN